MMSVMFKPLTQTKARVMLGSVLLRGLNQQQLDKCQVNLAAVKWRKLKRSKFFLSLLIFYDTEHFEASHQHSLNPFTNLF